MLNVKTFELTQEEYESDIEELMDYQSEFCLFDIGKKIVRKISIPEIDDLVDTEEDWKHLLSMLNNYDRRMHEYGV